MPKILSFPYQGHLVVVRRWRSQCVITALVILPLLLPVSLVWAAPNASTVIELPQQGELRLSGTVVDVDETKGVLILNAMKFTLPSGKSGDITPAKAKTITITAQTLVRRTDSKDKISLTELKEKGDGETPTLMITGVDGGTGQPLTAREIVFYGVKTVTTPVVPPTVPLAPATLEPPAAPTTQPAAEVPKPPVAAPPAEVPDIPNPGAELKAFKVVKVVPQAKSSTLDAANTQGDVAGSVTEGVGKFYQFLYSKGQVNRLPNTPFIIGALGAQGEIVGQMPTPMGMSACKFSGGQFQKIEGISYATGISEFGLVCGLQSENFHDVAVVSAEGQVQRVTDGQDEKESFASAMNAAGQIIGSITNLQGEHRAFISEAGKTQRLGTLGGKNSRATGISSSGLVVGESDVDGGNKHAFLFDGKKMFDLGTLDGPNSRAQVVNDSGQVVGSGEIRAFLYDHGQMKVLDDLLLDKGWTVSRALGITNEGQIAALASYEGTNHAVLLVPMPAPQ